MPEKIVDMHLVEKRYISSIIMFNNFNNFYVSRRLQTQNLPALILALHVLAKNTFTIFKIMFWTFFH